MAGTDQNAPVDELDPTADTPDLEDEEGAEADAQPEPDQDARYAEAQATITRQSQELAQWRKQAGAATESDGDEAGSDPSLSALEADSWTLAEQVYGGDAIEAYRAAADLLESAVTPADYMAAFEAYHSIRSGESAAPDATSDKPTRAQATTPRVDANRSDLGPDLQDAQEKLSEARKGKSLADFTNAATAALGFGRAK